MTNNFFESNITPWMKGEVVCWVGDKNFKGEVVCWVGDKNFIVFISGKEVLCHKDFWTKN